MKLMSKRERESLPTCLSWRRVYILPSNAGLFLSVIWGVMLMAGLNFNNNMALILVFFVFGIAHIVLYQTFLNLKGMVISAIDSASVFVGKPVKVYLSISSEINRYDICYSDLSETLEKIDVPVGKTQLLANLGLAKERGWFDIDHLKLYTRYPLGLFTSWVILRPKSRILVYPQPEEPCTDYPGHIGSSGYLKSYEKDIEVSYLREYQPGDPLRNIAWKKTAQTDNLTVKEHANYQGHELIFDYQDIVLESVELKLSRLTAWILKATDESVSYQLILPGFDSGQGSGQEHMHSCLKVLALFDPG